MYKSSFLIGLLVSPFVFAEVVLPPYSLAITNNTIGSSVTVGFYTAKGGYGSMTLASGGGTGSCPFVLPPAPPNPCDLGPIKNINITVADGKIIDNSSCNFVFNRFYQKVSVELNPSSENQEEVVVLCKITEMPGE